MKPYLFTTSVLFSLVLAIGCASNKPATGGEGLASRFDGEQVRVYLQGRDRGYTPMTLHVSRSRGEYEVALKKGRELVRQFEIALESSTTNSPERQAVFMDLEKDNSVMGIKTFGLEDLESSNDTLYFIPYYYSAISIDDVRYGLTLIITD